MELKITQEDNRFYLKGVINEFAKFDPLFEFKGASMILNLKDVTRINSTGVREWITAIEKVEPSIEMIFEECPPVVVYQMTMIPNFTSRVKVKSVYAPHYCEEGDIQKDFLIEMSEYDREEGLPEFWCEEYDAPYVFDDDEESYFYFVDLAAAEQPQR